jgi:hypothetical protein
MDILGAAGLSFVNIFSFLPFSRDVIGRALGDHPSSAALFVCGIQSILGVLLLFVLGLAIRNRFRMR